MADFPHLSHNLHIIYQNEKYHVINQIGNKIQRYKAASTLATEHRTKPEICLVFGKCGRLAKHRTAAKKVRNTF